MPRSALSDDELTQFITSIITEGGRPKVGELLDHCHEFKVFDGRNPCEIYFHKKLAYRDFEVHIPFFAYDGDTVMGADIQFKRPSKGPHILFNRNRPLVTKLLKLLRQRYSGIGVKDPLVTNILKYLGRSYTGIEVKDDKGGRQIHFAVASDASRWHVSTPFEEWDSECAIYDEPCSSGQTDPDRTVIRNDFVILRFRRT